LAGNSTVDIFYIIINLAPDWRELINGNSHNYKKVVPGTK